MTGGDSTPVGRNADDDHEDLRAAHEAVARRRGAATGGPDDRWRLASALHLYGVRLGEAGRHDEAVTVIDEAVALYRRLAATNDDTAPDLAITLHSLARRLSAVGRHDEALARSREAVDVQRRLAATPSRRSMHSLDLALGLESLGARLADAGRDDEAVDVLAECVVVLRRRMEDHDGRHASDVATALAAIDALSEDGARARHDGDDRVA